MLIWPVIFGIAAKLLTKDNRDSNSSKIFTKIFRLNVVVQIVMIYFCFYLIYYTTEFIKALYNEEVMSGHIYTGLLSASSFLSTTIFTHHFRSRSNNIYKVFEIVCFLYIFHMGYSFFWTSFAFHSIFDSIVGLIVGCFCAFLIQCADGLCYFDFDEPIIMYAARFMVGIIKSAMVEFCQLFFGLSTD